jgi:hypothetical protein
MLDARRNRIFTYDQPGAFGPGGGPPAFKGTDAFASYLHAQGVRYIAYILGPSSPEYKLDLWEGRVARTDPTNGRGGYLKNQARFDLDFFQVLTSLSASRAVLFSDGDIRVLDLEKPAH